jgi:hypothetical protein
MPGDTRLTRVASDRTVARTPVATCARVAPAMCAAGVTDRLPEMKDLVEMLEAFNVPLPGPYRSFSI